MDELIINKFIFFFRRVKGNMPIKEKIKILDNNAFKIAVNRLVYNIKYISQKVIRKHIFYFTKKWVK